VIELTRARSPEVRLVVPLTTRARRTGEVDGVDHRFISRPEFERLRAEDGLLEWSEFADVYYGTDRQSVTTVMEAGWPVLLSLDPAGARLVRQALPEARLVYLASPLDPAVRSGESPPTEFDVTIVADTVARAAERLVTLLGSPALL
jgi:guanylate kinase